MNMHPDAVHPADDLAPHSPAVASTGLLGAPVSRRVVLAGGLAAAVLVTTAERADAVSLPVGDVALNGPRLLSEPYQLGPTSTSTHVVWHTEAAGVRHHVVYGSSVPEMTDREVLDAALGSSAGDGRRWRRATADTHRLTQTAEDAASAAPLVYAAPTPRPVHRHSAHIEGLPAHRRVPYRVVSVDESLRATLTPVHSLAPSPPKGRGVKVWLTSDHQLKRMTPANIQKVAETVGVELDGVLFAGDLVNIPDRASEWFDSTTGLAFFAGLTGRGRSELSGRTYTGAPMLQNTPLYPAIGNHEVMGRRLPAADLNTQFAATQPREVAEARWDAGEGHGDREEWIHANSWNTTTYEEMFPWPRSREGGSTYWAASIGDMRIVTLFVTQIWRTPADIPGFAGKFSEGSLDEADWGYGQHIFEPIAKGSAQYRWLERELNSNEWRSARHRVVMYHHPAHGLGDNSAPPFTDPVQTVERDASGAVTRVSYRYPLEDDHILRDLEPLFSAHGVDLVLNGHSHVWNRFRNPAGVNWLETSNVGNSYGAYDRTSGASRNLPDDPSYVRQGDPGRLQPIVPTVAPLRDAAGRPLPFVSSNDITCFSILDSEAGVVRSYRFDTREPDGEVVLFDEFPLG